MELDIIDKSGFTHYFLIVRDYADFAHQKGYPLSARGSAAGSLVLYAIDVISFNPMDHGCMFERFLNLERINPPDIDIDFDDRSRDLVVDYLKEKYGEECVAKVAVYSSLNIRSALSDVARSLSLPHEKIKRLTKLSEEDLTNSLERSVKKILQGESQDKINKLCELSKKVVGSKRHVSCHASAVVISNNPLVENVPVFVDKNGTVATQFDGKTVEEMGMIKFDFLGSRSISIAHECIKLVNKNHGTNLSITTIPFDDEKAHELVAAGYFAGIFQLEGSTGMGRMAQQVRPENFEQFAAIPALYRPGPLQSGMAEKYIARKHGRERIEYLHSLAEDALKNTYGVCVYQEQVMQIARDVAGYTLAEADVLRYAIGKKVEGMLNEQRGKFVEGCIKNGLSEGEANSIFSILEPFGAYAFNKSHSVAYAMLAYRMCYLKANYPHEFISSCLTGTSRATDKPYEKIAKVIDESKSLAKHLDVNIEILHPCINESSIDFTCNEKSIRFGLNSIKGLPTASVEAILKNREAGKFESFEDFCIRIDKRKVTPKAMSTLASSGALDCFGHHRAKIVHNSETILKKLKKKQQNPLQGQISIFGDVDSNINRIELEDCDQWEDTELLSNERKVLGIYLSDHPLEKHSETLSKYISSPINEIETLPEGKFVTLAGTVEKKKNFKTRAGKNMAKFELQDLGGRIDCVVFSDNFESTSWIEEGSPIVIQGQLSEENTQVKIKRIMELSEITSLATCLEITLSRKQMEESLMNSVKSILLKHKGDKRVILQLENKDGIYVAAACPHKMSVNFDDELMEEISTLIGSANVKQSNLTGRLNM